MKYRNSATALLAVLLTVCIVFFAGCPSPQQTEGAVEVTPSSGGAAASYTPHSPTRFELADGVKLIWFRESGEYQISFGKWDGQTVWPLHDVYEDAIRGSMYDYMGHGFGIIDEVSGQLCLAFVATDMVEEGQRVLALYPSPTEVRIREGEAVGVALAKASKAHLSAQHKASSQKEAKKK